MNVGMDEKQPLYEASVEKCGTILKFWQYMYGAQNLLSVPPYQYAKEYI